MLSNVVYWLLALCMLEAIFCVILIYRSGCDMHQIERLEDIIALTRLRLQDHANLRDKVSDLEEEISDLKDQRIYLIKRYWILCKEHNIGYWPIKEVCND